MDNPALDAAMANVLAAEGRARAAVDECAREAERLLAAAREREKVIAERAAQRAGAARAAMAAKLAARLDGIEAAERATAEVGIPSDADRARLEAAVERLADELAGGSP